MRMRHEVINSEGEPLEIERKFLLTETPPSLGVYTKHEIEQGYLGTSDDGRIRKSDDQYFKTVKKGEGKVRVEIESQISKEEFERLWPTTEGKRVSKTRYLIPYQENTIEVDLYHGALTGLLTAEVEFSSIDDCDKFIPPNWFGRELTEDKKYSNYYLSIDGIPKE